MPRSATPTPTSLASFLLAVWEGLAIHRRSIDPGPGQRVSASFGEAAGLPVATRSGHRTRVSASGVDEQRPGKQEGHATSSSVVDFWVPAPNAGLARSSGTAKVRG